MLLDNAKIGSPHYTRLGVCVCVCVCVWTRSHRTSGIDVISLLYVNHISGSDSEREEFVVSCISSSMGGIGQWLLHAHSNMQDIQLLFEEVRCVCNVCARACAHTCVFACMYGSGCVRF